MLKFATTFFVRKNIPKNILTQLTRSINSEKFLQQLQQIEEQQNIEKRSTRIYEILNDNLASLKDFTGSLDESGNIFVDVFQDNPPKKPQEILIYLRFRRFFKNLTQFEEAIKKIDMILTQLKDSEMSFDAITRLYQEASLANCHQLSTKLRKKIQEEVHGGVGTIFTHQEEDNYQQPPNYGGQTDLSINNLLQILEGFAYSYRGGLPNFKRILLEFIIAFLINPNKLSPMQLAKLIKLTCSLEYSLDFSVDKWLELLGLMNNALQIAKSRAFQMSKQQMLMYTESALYLNNGYNIQQILELIQTQIFAFGRLSEHQDFYFQVLNADLYVRRTKNQSLFKREAISLMVQTIANKFLEIKLEQEAEKLINILDLYLFLGYDSQSVGQLILKFMSKRNKIFISGIEYLLKATQIPTKDIVDFKNNDIKPSRKGVLIRWLLAMNQAKDQDVQIQIQSITNQITQDVAELRHMYLQGLSKSYLKGTSFYSKIAKIVLDGMMQGKQKISGTFASYLSNTQIPKQKQHDVVEWLKNVHFPILLQSKPFYILQSIFSPYPPSIHQIKFFYNMVMSLQFSIHALILEFICNKRAILASTYRHKLGDKFMKLVKPTLPLFILVKVFMNMDALRIGDADKVKAIILSHPDILKKRIILELMTVYKKDSISQEKPIYTKSKQMEKQKKTKTQRMVQSVSKRI